MPLSGKDKWWYSFDFGPIHFLQYSTEHDFAPGKTLLSCTFLIVRSRLPIQAAFEYICSDCSFSGCCKQCPALNQLSEMISTIAYENPLWS